MAIYFITDLGDKAYENQTCDSAPILLISLHLGPPVAGKFMVGAVGHFYIAVYKP